MSSTLHRHFLTLRDGSGRQVHYRRAGRGPAVILLHQSPQSSRELEPLMAAWSRHFTLIAPDTPGYGLSPHLPDSDAGMEDFARSTLAFADALGLQRFGVYGYHTGGSIGITLAALAPERVSAVCANGLVALDDDEIAAIVADYLPVVAPAWDGSHLAWLWARMREQAIFFPWYDARLETRLHYDVPSPERLQEGLDEFMAAGPHYRSAYHAAFTAHAERRLPDMRVPALVTAAARDPLAQHLARLVDAAPSVTVAVSADPDDALTRCLAHLREHPGDGCPSNPEPPHAAGGRFYAGEPGRQWLVEVLAEGHGEPVLLVHGPGETGRRMRDWARRLAPGRPAFALDLPGHGGSDPSSGSPVAAAASAVREVARSIGDATDIAGIESGALPALAGASLAGYRHAVTLVDPPCFRPEEAAEWRERGLPALTPLWHGGHLLECWHMLRDSRLFHPWYRRERECIRNAVPDLDPARLHEALCDRFRSNGTWQSLMAGLLEFPLRGQLKKAGARATVHATRDGAFAASSRRLATDAVPVRDLP